MSARRAALLLHALDGADRDWLLQRLSAPAQQRASTMLSELTELGIPSDRRFVDDAIAAAVGRSAGAAAAAPRPAEPADDVARLASAEAAAVAEALRREPAPFVARLLASRSWPWRDEVARRLRLPAPAATTRPAPQLESAAARMLAGRLHATAALSRAAVTAAAAKPPWWSIAARRWR